MPTHALVLRGAAPGDEISQHGITWTFSTTVTYGQFCNGDYWVVGPVTITAITPATQVVETSRTINGTMVNPSVIEDTGGGAFQGFDSRLLSIYSTGSYSDSLNIGTQLPYVAATGSSIVSMVSVTPEPSVNYPTQSYCAILTVLASPPPAGSFRPPYAGTVKTIEFNESDLNYSVLASLAPASSPPDLSDTAAEFQAPWIDNGIVWQAQYLHPELNQPYYGRDLASLVGTAALLLNCNYTNGQKRDLLVYLTQVGIDYYRNVTEGCHYAAGGGGVVLGRKFPIVFAGLVLGDTDMLNVGTTYASDDTLSAGNAATFGEDSEFFYVRETSPGVYNFGNGGYGAGDVGVAEWGVNHCVDSSTDDETFDPTGATGNNYRYCCTATGLAAQALAIRIMGIEVEWNRDEFLDYIDRYVSIMPNVPPSSYYMWDQWHARMWADHRASF